MYNKIVNPKSGKRVSIYGNLGKKILKNYLKIMQSGGGCSKTSDCRGAGKKCRAADTAEGCEYIKQDDIETKGVSKWGCYLCSGAAAAAVANNQVAKFVAPCHQQVGNTCSRWAIRVGIEHVHQRYLSPEEDSLFKAIPCALIGSLMSLAIVVFNRTMPDLMDSIELEYYPPEPEHTRSSRTTKTVVPSAYVTVDEMKALFDDNPGCVLILNVQNIDFKKNIIVYADPKAKKKEDRGEGHCICCIGYDDDNLILHDSNIYAGSCRKTLSLALVEEGQAALDVGAREGGETFLTAMRNNLHIQECYLMTRV